MKEKLTRIKLADGKIVQIDEWLCTRKSFVGPQSLTVSDLNCLGAVVYGIVTSGFNASAQGLEPFRILVGDKIYVDGIVADWSFGAQHERYYKLVHALAKIWTQDQHEDARPDPHLKLQLLRNAFEAEQEFNTVAQKLLTEDERPAWITSSNLGTCPLHLPAESHLRIEAPEWCRTTLSMVIKRPAV